MITGLNKIKIEYLLKKQILKLSCNLYPSFFKALKNAQKLTLLRRTIYGNSRILKLIESDGRHYYDLYAPGWPSEQFDRFITSELLRIEPAKTKSKIVLNTLIFAVTKKCPLQCQHCFEWDELNKNDTLTSGRTEAIIKDFVDAGVVSVHISGGEPLLKLNELAPIVKKYSNKSDFWLLTSGYTLDEKKALIIKENGFKGVIISLDNYKENEHDAFRGTQNSFRWVMDAVKNCKSKGLVVALTVCITREIAHKKDIERYMELAKNLKVDFVQWLEPKPVGHFKDKDVKLDKEMENLLDKMYLNYNYSFYNRKYPIVDYHGYHQRRLGCFSAGNRNLYIDTDGNIQACPFCKTKIIKNSGNSLDALNSVKMECEQYEKAV